MTKYQLSDIEKRILAVLQEGFPRTRTPFKDMAERAGVETEEFLAVLKTWKQEGRLRRIGSILHHSKVGFPGGAMVAWKVADEKVERVGSILAGFKEVSHAYERNTAENWPYNIYTMVHGGDMQEVGRTVERMSRECAVTDYRILATERELKKVPPTYIMGTKPETQEEE